MDISKTNLKELAAIIDGLNSLTNLCHSRSYGAGWWTDHKSGVDLREEVRNGTRLGKAIVAEKIALVHSEVSESMEGHRKGLMDDKLPQYGMFETEMADVIIRVADLLGACGIGNIGQIVFDKLEFNRQRPDHKIENRMAEGGKAY